jgi:hypothetical protein
MANNQGGRIHPLPVFCFRVTIEVGNLGSGTAMFKSVGGLKYETEVDPDFIAWRESWLRGKKPSRAAGRIVQLDNALKGVCAWSFEQGWPCKWEVSEFDASKNELAIETLEIAHEGLTFEQTPPPDPAPAK